MEDGVNFCKHRMHMNRLNSRGLWQPLLRNCLIRAEDIGDKDKANGIKGVINREESGRMWYFINRVTDDPRTGGCLRVER